MAVLIWSARICLMSVVSHDLNLDLLRMDDFDIRIAGKPGLIEGKDRGQPVSLHRCNESRIMCRFAEDLMSKYERFPRRINCGRFWKEEENALDSFEFRLRFRSGHAEPVLGDGTSCDGP
jgi:hypothetical protein